MQNQQRDHLSKEDWQDWLSLPQTKAFFEAVRGEQEVMLQALVKLEDMDSLKQSRALGVLSGLQKVLDFEYDDGINN